MSPRITRASARRAAASQAASLNQSGPAPPADNSTIPGASPAAGPAAVPAAAAATAGSAAAASAPSRKRKASAALLPAETPGPPAASSAAPAPAPATAPVPVPTRRAKRQKVAAAPPPAAVEPPPPPPPPAPAPPAAAPRNSGTTRSAASRRRGKARVIMSSSEIPAGPATGSDPSANPAPAPATTTPAATAAAVPTVATATTTTSSGRKPGRHRKDSAAQSPSSSGRRSRKAPNHDTNDPDLDVVMTGTDEAPVPGPAPLAAPPPPPQDMDLSSDPIEEADMVDEATVPRRRVDGTDEAAVAAAAAAVAEARHRYGALVGLDQLALDHHHDAFVGGYVGGGPAGARLNHALHAIQGMVSGVTARLREILTNLRQKDDPSVQLIALQDLAEILLVSNEDNLAGHFSADAYVKELVLLMQVEDSPEIMLMACRCLANLIEALPGSISNVVYGGAVPILCQKLLEISFIDLAEQALTTLEKISAEFPSSIVREGGLTACLSYLEFFATATQRSAVTVAANCCRNIPEDSFPVVRDAMPILLGIFASSDQRVVEQASLCVTGIVESFKYHPHRLEELVGVDLLGTVLRLLVPGAANMIGTNIHTQFLRMLAFTAHASPRLAAELFRLNVVETLYQILTGVSPPGEDEDDLASRLDSVVVMQALIHRPRDQIIETLNVICELLPGLPKNSDPSFGGFVEASRDPGAGTLIPAVSEPASGGGAISGGAATAHRIELLRALQPEVRRFALILFPTLTDAYSSTINLSVRQKVLTAQNRMLSNLDRHILAEALSTVPYASFLTSILSQGDHPTLVMHALQATEFLLSRLDDIYRYQLYREGVISEVTKLATAELLPESKPGCCGQPGHHHAAAPHHPNPHHVHDYYHHPARDGSEGNDDGGNDGDGDDDDEDDDENGADGHGGDDDDGDDDDDDDKDKDGDDQDDQDDDEDVRESSDPEVEADYVGNDADQNGDPDDDDNDDDGGEEDENDEPGGDHDAENEDDDRPHPDDDDVTGSPVSSNGSTMSLDGQLSPVRHQHDEHHDARHRHHRAHHHRSHPHPHNHVTTSLDGLRIRIRDVARKFLETHEGESHAVAMKAKATAILADLSGLVADLEAFYVHRTTAGLGHDHGRALFAQLARYFNADVLESVTSAELLGSGMIRVLLDILGRDTGPHAAAADDEAAAADDPAGRARATFLEIFMARASGAGVSASGGRARLKPGPVDSPSTPFSVMVHKLQDVLSRSEHFEVVTVHQNTYDGNRSSAATMLAKQIRLRLVADEDSNVPRPLRNIMVSIHAIANFKALEDYLRPRLLLPDRLRGPPGPRTAQGLSRALAAMANSAGLPLGTALAARLAATEQQQQQHALPPPPPAPPAGPSSSSNSNSGSKLAATSAPANSRLSRKAVPAAKSRSANQPDGAPSAAPAAVQTPPPATAAMTTPSLPSAGKEKAGLRRPSRRSTAPADGPAAAAALAAVPPPPPPPPQDDDDMQDTLECADEKQMSEDDDDDIMDEDGPLDAIVDQDMMEDHVPTPEPAAISLEVATGGKMTALNEHAAHGPTLSQGGSASPSSALGHNRFPRGGLSMLPRAGGTTATAVTNDPASTSIAATAPAAAAAAATTTNTTATATTVTTETTTPSPSAVSARAFSSYAAAVHSGAGLPDWRIEFSLDGKAISNETTVYRAVHESTPAPDENAPTRTIWSHTHSINFRRVPAGPHPTDTLSSSSSYMPSNNVEPVAAGSASEPEPQPQPLGQGHGPGQGLGQTQAHEQASIGGAMSASLIQNPLTAAILRLLNILHDLNANIDEVLSPLAAADANREPLAQFVNTKLTAKLNRQLEEPLIVASNCLPGWAEDLARLYPFLFPFETRHLFLQSTSFGYARSMTRWQNAQAEEQHRRASDRRDDRPFLGRLQRQKVRISRTKMLESALKVMELYGASQSILEVEYFEEVGTGLGPTLEFYSTVSREFAKRRLRLWRDVDYVGRAGAGAGPDLADAGADGDGDGDGDDSFVSVANGMFPRPVSEQELATPNGERLLHLFRMLGKFVARSMIDSRIIDLSFNAIFFRVGAEGARPSAAPLKPSLAAVRLVDPGLAQSLKAIRRFATARRELEEDPALSPYQKVAAIEAIVIDNVRLDDLCLDFTLPGHPDIELIPNGSQARVSIENVDLYLDRVLDMTLGSGVRHQIDAFRAGFSQVFPYSALSAFTPDELVNLFGRVEEDWSLETLMDSIKADHGYNLDNKSVKNLLQIMSEFNPSERRLFLQFTTGSPKLPIGGFKALTPMFTVVLRAKEAPYTFDDYLPSVMTCVNYLKLPDYSTIWIMRKQLMTAIKEGQGAFHLS